MQIMRLPLAAIGLIALAGAAAAESYDISGSSTGKSTNTYVPMGESHIYVDLSSKFSLPDNGTPMAGMAGECFGYMEIAVGAGATGSGMCVWKDGDGDAWYGPWSVNGMSAERASLGTWYVSGGTGKFANATGGGTFKSLTNPETGDSKLDVLGSVTLN